MSEEEMDVGAALDEFAKYWKDSARSRVVASLRKLGTFSEGTLVPQSLTASFESKLVSENKK